VIMHGVEFSRRTRCPILVEPSATCAARSETNEPSSHDTDSSPARREFAGGDVLIVLRASSPDRCSSRLSTNSSAALRGAFLEPALKLVVDKGPASWCPITRHSRGSDQPASGKLAGCRYCDNWYVLMRFGDNLETISYQT
jgi:hypothetical protein